MIVIRKYKGLCQTVGCEKEYYKIIKKSWLREQYWIIDKYYENGKMIEKRQSSWESNPFMHNSDFLYVLIEEALNAVNPKKDIMTFIGADYVDNSRWVTFKYFPLLFKVKDKTVDYNIETFKNENAELFV